MLPEKTLFFLPGKDQYEKICVYLQTEK